ncbi:basigin-like [Antechinus flavipes]|uniref:basigin-like n=1 Tax=Antechinus flavipes TaxID=38775 RepID=UPI002235EF70|nr:basigin-like [Antechinus flavipes]
MGFALRAKVLGLALVLGILAVSPWEVRTAAVWRTGVAFEPHLYLTCTLNKTEEEARPEEDLTAKSGGRWLRDAWQLREDRFDSSGKAPEAPKALPKGEFQFVFPDKPACAKPSKRLKKPPKVFAKPKIERAMEGQDVILACESRSYPCISYWDWYRHHEVNGDRLLLNGTGRRVFITESGHRSELILRRLDAAEDPGHYICVGSNSQGHHAAVVLLKVRSHFAALWPLLGIVFEMLLLFTILLFNEFCRGGREQHRRISSSAPPPSPSPSPLPPPIPLPRSKPIRFQNKDGP